MADTEMQKLLAPSVPKAPDTTINIDDQKDNSPATNQPKSEKIKTFDIKSKENTQVNLQMLNAIRKNDIAGFNDCLERSTDLNFKFGSNQMSALHYATQEQFTDAVDVLIKRGADVKITNSQEQTPLYIAVDLANETLVQKYIDAQADIDHQDADDNTVIHLAARNGIATILSKLIGTEVTEKIYQKNNQGRTPLHLAAESGSVECIKILLGDPAKKRNTTQLNEKDVKGNTALHIAAFRGKYEALVELLSAGANPLLGNADGRTPLHLASIRGHTDCVEYLIHNGDSQSDVNATDKTDCTPLHLAAKGGHVDVVKSLIFAGAKVDSGDKNNSTALHMAAAAGKDRYRKEILQMLSCPETLIQVKDKSEDTPLHKAASAGNEEAVNFLIEIFESKLEKKDVQTGSSLKNAKGKSPSVNPLPEANDTNPNSTEDGNGMPRKMSQEFMNTFVNVRGAQERTPLHRAAAIGCESSIRILLKLGADLGLKTSEGISAISLILKMPNGVRILSKAFDDAITKTTQSKDQDSEKQEKEQIKFDYTVLLTEHNRKQQLSVIEDILDDKKAKTHELLEHPLVESFLYFKWRKTWFIFFINILFYLALVGGITTFVMNRITHTTGDPNNGTSTQLDNPENLNADMPKLELSLKIIILMILVQEVFQFSALPTQYFLAVETWIKFGALISSTAILFAEKQDPWVLHTSIFAVLLGWTEVTLLIGRFPSLGIYPLMFYTISKHLVKFIAVFFFLLAGFAFSFHIIFRGREAFHDSPFLPMLLVRTTAMMIGDTAFDEFFKHGEYDAIGTAQVVYLCFLLFVALVLMNLLIALAVDDIQGLQKLGHITKLKKQAQFIIFVEDMVYSPLFQILVYEPILDAIKEAINQEPSVILYRSATSNWSRNDPASSQATSTEPQQSDQQTQPTCSSTFLALLNRFKITFPRHKKHCPPLPLVDRASDISTDGGFKSPNISIGEVHDTIEKNSTDLTEIKEHIVKVRHEISGSEPQSDQNSHDDQEEWDDDEESCGVPEQLHQLQSDINDLKELFHEWKAQNKGWKPIKNTITRKISSVLK